LFDDHPAIAMPVFSSGQTIRQAHPTYQALQRADLIFAAGGGIMAHPGGPGDGVRSLREAWQAAMSGITLEAASKSSKILREAMETFA
jgi:ribulose-bisphosphate carboxylase large chain